MCKDFLGLGKKITKCQALARASDGDIFRDHYNDHAFTVVLDTVGMDEADVREERISVLIFVFGDILWIHRTHEERVFTFHFAVFAIHFNDLRFNDFTHLADVFQIHGVHDDLVIIRHELFVDGVMERPRLW